MKLITVLTAVSFLAFSSHLQAEGPDEDDVVRAPLPAATKSAPRVEESKSHTWSSLAYEFMRSFFVVDCFDGDKAPQNYNMVQDVKDGLSSIRNAGIKGSAKAVFNGAKDHPGDLLILSGVGFAHLDGFDVKPYLLLLSGGASSIKSFKSQLPQLENIYGSNMSPATKTVLMGALLLYCAKPAAAAVMDTPMWGETYQDYLKKFSGGPCSSVDPKKLLLNIDYCLNPVFGMKSGDITLYDCRNVTPLNAHEQLSFAQYARTEAGVVRTTFSTTTPTICHFTNIDNGPVIKTCFEEGSDKLHSEIVSTASMADITEGLKVGKIQEVVAATAYGKVCGFHPLPRDAVVTADDTPKICLNYATKGQPEVEFCFSKSDPTQVSLKLPEHPSLNTTEVASLEEDQVQSEYLLTKVRVPTSPPVEQVAQPQENVQVAEQPVLTPPEDAALDTKSEETPEGPSGSSRVAEKPVLTVVQDTSKGVPAGATCEISLLEALKAWWSQSPVECKTKLVREEI